MYFNPISIFAASNGNPIGLTRKASTKRMIPFVTEHVSMIKNASIPRIVPANERTNAEQDNIPIAIHVNKSITNATGNNIIFRIIFIGHPSLPASYKRIFFVARMRRHLIFERVRMIFSAASHSDS